VLVCIARDPGVRLRDIADRLSITERSAHGIVADSSGERELKTGTLDVSEHRTLPAPGTTISGTLHLTAAIDVPS